MTDYLSAGSPNSGTTGAVLARGRIDLYRSLGSFGKPAYQSYVQLKAMLRAKCGDEVASYFARPSYDPAAGELSWTAEVAGIPRRWEDMDEGERDSASLKFEVIRSQLIALAAELRAQGAHRPGGATAFAELLDRAMQTPAQGGEFLQFVHDQPIISFWGFQDQMGRSVSPALPLRAAPGAEDRSQGASSSAPGAVASGDAATGRRWRSWWLLALLLVVALLLLLLRHCTAGDPGPGAIGGALPVSPAASPPLPSDTARGEGPGALDPSRIEGPPGASSQRGVATPGDSGSVPADPARPGLPGAPAPDADKAAPGDPGSTPPNEASEDKRKPDEAKPEDPKDPQAKDQPLPGADTKPAAKDPKAMNLPDSPADKEKLDYLEGEWKAGEGLFDQRTRQPLDMTLDFDDAGKGKITLRRPDGSRCSGPVQGTMSGGKLSIAGASVPCSDGSAYAPPKIECTKDRQGATKCFGVNKDGSSYQMGIRRQ